MFIFREGGLLEAVTVVVEKIGVQTKLIQEGTGLKHSTTIITIKARHLRV